MLNEELLKKAVLVLGAKTYSQAVNWSLLEAIKLAQIRGLSNLIGSGLWEGSLSEMRSDQPRTKRKKG